MAERISIECSGAAALAAKLARVEVIAAYPITPQTHIVEKLSQYVADGELDAEYIAVESEHSAMSACVGASAVGARAFTATCGQGLALMHEVLFIASGMRLPVVMCNTNRSLSPGLNIWSDQSDMMASRDCGWIQIYAEDAQEIFDMIICAFKIGEDERVLLPVVVNFDGFYATHVTEPMVALDQSEVDAFLPPRKIPSWALHPDRPTTWGAIGFPWLQTEFKKQNEDALRNSKLVIKEVWRQFGDAFGRYYDVLEPYKADDADLVFVMMGSHCGSARLAVDELRGRGVKAGMFKLRLFRPFPHEELVSALKGRRIVVVVDKSFSFGDVGGPLFCELRSAFYDIEPRPKILGFIAGIGGRDIAPDEFVAMAEKSLRVAEGREGMDRGFAFFQARE